MRQILNRTLLLLVLAPSAVFAAEPGRGPVSAEIVADSLMLTFVGDIMHHEQNAAMPDYDRLYDAVRDELLSDHLSFANIEFPVVEGKAPAGYPLFNGTREYVQAAIASGFDVFALANNHSFDWGPAGAASTLRVFNDLALRHGIHHNGIRSPESGPLEPTVIRRNGWSVAFVSISLISNVRGSSPYIYLVDYRDSNAVSGFLQQMRAWDEAYDLLVVGVHGGSEYVSDPDPWKAALFREMIAHGADIVWGHHPHVLQPVELVETGSTRKLILHSTGNFVSAQRRYQRPDLPVGRWAPTGDTALFQVVVERLSSSGTLRPAVSVAQVWTPIMTVHEDPMHGYVLRLFGSLLVEPLPLVWRAFYAARYAVTRSFLSRPLTGFVALKTPELEP